ncbi:hypothetical protein JW964_18290 [candidate division KSB1 bacterium]|nr:hypothetical protein [candidate division KSB1 bacterium]
MRGFPMTGVEFRETNRECFYTNSVRHAHEISFYFYKIERRVMPECFYRASIISEKMDSRQKHAGMTVIGA